MRSNIALIGFMGTGKSAAGTMLAERLGKRFVETDALVEERAGKPIGRIFAEGGEGSFRVIEKGVIKDVSAMDGLVISCGGGAVLDIENVEALRSRSVVVLLKASPRAIMERIARGDARPLLGNRYSLEDVKRLLDSRTRAYESAADFAIDTTGLDVGTVVDIMIEKVGK